jgi:hypothetical protein
LPTAPPSAPDGRDPGPGPGQGPRLFARNRRDGARLLSSILIITTIGLVAWSHPLGRGVALAGGALSLFWWLQYRQLQQ